MHSVILSVRYFTGLSGLMYRVVMMVAPRVNRHVGLNFCRNERSKTFGKIEKGGHMVKKRSDLRKLRSLLP